MLNKFILEGRLTADPEMQQTQGGAKLCKFRVAVERNRRDENGDFSADFFNVVAWNKTADTVCNYIGKGRLVVISGRMEIEKYTDKSGANREFYRVIAEEVHFADSRPQAVSYQAAPEQKNPIQTRLSTDQAVQAWDPAPEENLPF